MTSQHVSPIRLRRRRTLDQLGRVSKQIEQLLNDQELTLAQVELPQEKRPGETPLERLRRFKAELQAALARLERGEAARCELCGAPFSPAFEDETPWATRCVACVTKT